MDRRQVKRMANKFSYNKVIQRYCIQYGWEDVSEYKESDIKSGKVTPKDDLKEYRISEGAPYRLISRRVPNIPNVPQTEGLGH